MSRGVIDEELEQDLLDDLRWEIRDAVDGMRSPELAIPDERIRDEARRAVRRFFGRELGRKPLCYAVVARA